MKGWKEVKEIENSGVGAVWGVGPFGGGMPSCWPLAGPKGLDIDGDCDGYVVDFCIFSNL
jgi:hypothetical protein